MASHVPGDLTLCRVCGRNTDENTRCRREPAYVCGWHFNLPVNLTHTQPSCWCSLPSLMWECVAQRRCDPVEREGVMAQGWRGKKFHLVVICLRYFNKIHWENNSSLALPSIFWPECDVGWLIGDVKKHLWGRLMLHCFRIRLAAYEFNIHVSTSHHLSSLNRN